jgi:hypothetical protein
VRGSHGCRNYRGAERRLTRFTSVPERVARRRRALTSAMANRAPFFK